MQFIGKFSYGGPIVIIDQGFDTPRTNQGKKGKCTHG